ncbi:MAG TPA: ImmA/IrrE family metallo-endopeptidase [Gemmataceae bacterium]|nr:ImmA/IrrE family metallo-endopeptidase [Gemmataceae bacterium]
MVDELSREEVTDAVDRSVQELLEAAGVQAPPVDAIALAQRQLGMVVCLDRRQEARGRAQRAAGRKQIFLRPEPSEERHQWTVAHEIGDHLKAALLQRLRVPPEQVRALTGVSLANLFAHRLLVPTCWFRADAPAFGYDVLQLKRRYRTASHQVIALRFLDLPEPCVVTIFDNGHITTRKSNGPPVKAKQPEPVEQECQQYVSRCSRPRVLRGGGWTVQGWPVHQPDWKREILRSVRDEE